jgi:phosphate acetyltransferase
MTRSVYISTAEPGSGKIMFALGLVELALRQTTRVAFYRPVIQAPTVGDRDEDIDLILRHFQLSQTYEESFAWYLQELQERLGNHDEDAVIERIIERYKYLEGQYDFILIEGTDFLGHVSALEIDLNAWIAHNLSSPVLVVGNAHGRTPREALDAVHLSVDAYEEKNCLVAGVVLNKAEPASRQALAAELAEEFGHSGKLVGVFPYDRCLESPTVREVAQQLDAKVLFGSDRLDNQVNGYLVGAMHLQNLLSWLEKDQLVLTPGDRADVLLGVIEADRSVNYPRMAGLVLTSGIRPDPEVFQLVEGLRESLPILCVNEDTYTVASRLEHIHAGIKAEDTDKIQRALSLFERDADLDGILRQFRNIPAAGMTPRMFTYNLVQQAKADRRHIVLPEGEEPRILRAAADLVEREIADITLLGKRKAIEQVIRDQGIALELDRLNIIEPVSSPHLETYAQAYYALRRHKGMTLDMARDCMLDVAYYGTMMVHQGHADGMVSGAIHTTQHTIRPALQFIKTRPGFSIVSSVFFMCLEDGVVVYGDCAVNPDPNAQELAEIAISSADTARVFGIEPRVALLSYSTGESGAGEEVEKVREATRLAHAMRPDLAMAGPIQYDAAVDQEVAALKMPGSEVAGLATVLVFPDLNTGNNTYKAVQRETGAIAIGPILQGLRKPVNDLSRGCTVDDIINTVVITAIQAQSEMGAEAGV